MKKLVRIITSLCLVAASTVTTAGAQGKFTYDDIASGRFSARSGGSFRSMNDGEHYTANRMGAIIRYDYATGNPVDTLLDTTTTGLPLFFRSYEFSGDESQIMFTYNSRSLYRRSAFSSYAVYSRATGKLDVIGDELRMAILAPSGDKVAYVKDNNVYIYSITDGSHTAVTTDGKWNHIINGVPDWVYEEEWAIDRTLCWSPDGKRLAWLRTDETHVKEFPFTQFNTADKESNYTSIYSYKYPKAGEQNSFVTLWVYDTTDGSRKQVDVGPELDQYVPFFDWTPDGKLYFFRINRLQNHLEIVLNEADGTQRTIYEEMSPKYIDAISAETITFLDDKRFIVRNETATGWMHLYLYHTEKGLLNPITSGEWEVTNVVAMDNKNIWYISTERSPLQRDFYRIGINGKNKKRLSTADGTWSVSASAGCKYYVANYSTISTPTVSTLHKGDGTLVRVLEDNAALRETIKEINMPLKELFTFTTPEGYTLNGFMTRPADFDPNKKYPVLMTQYSGPGSQEVTDSWFVSWEDALVQEGYIVACVDPRGTGYRGEEFKKLSYGIMGRLETEDQISAAKYLATLPYVDAERIGIYGWSYGGYMALNCILKGADVFKSAISVAPVTSWRYYDSVYTERVNGLPQTNAEGYDEPSPIGYADRLKGNLLLMHGTADDNVHIQNTYNMLSRFVQAGKQLDVMIYPDANHSMVPGGSTHIRKYMIDWCKENL